MKALCAYDSQRGSALMIVLVMLVILGFSATMAGKTWKTTVQQAREEELLFRGDQYRRAIESYYSFAHAGRSGTYPAKLEDLMKDPRSLQALRHLRRPFNDPMTGEEWALVKDEGGRIRGVYSMSSLEPFKKDGFSQDYEKFKGAKAYSDWKFVYEPKTAQKKTTAAEKTGTNPPAGNTPSETLGTP